MPKLLAFVSLVLISALLSTARPAQAADSDRGAIGQVVIWDGGTATSLDNRTTAVPFTLQANQKVSVQCGPDAGAWVAFDGRSTCPAAYPCILIPAGGLLDDTVRRNLDGGLSRIAVKCPVADSACSCTIFDNAANQ